MSLKRIILANYISQLYVTLSGILLVPIYAKYMGPEAYGLVGFFTMLQAWFALLDLGLTPTISRETARYRGGAVDPITFLQLFRSLTVIFLGIAVGGGLLLLSLSPVIASRWLNVVALNVSDVVIAVEIMAVSVALRWLGGLYRGVITGSERLVWMSAFNALLATLRFAGVLLSMWYFGFSPFVFFIHQLCVAVIELFFLFAKSQSLLPIVGEEAKKIGWSLAPVRSLLKFSLTIAFTSSVWVIVTQTDKLVLSGILTLTDYGYFTLAVLVASGITIVCGPVSSAIMPRMAMLHSEGKAQELVSVYRNATKIVSLVAGTAAITMVVCSKSLLFAWTGSLQFAEQVDPILKLYAIGNGILAVGAFPYYMQYARGDLKYHMIGNLLMLVILLPSIIYATINYGAIGAGYAWLITNFIYLTAWVGYVHRKLEPGLHLKWIVQDVFFIVFPASAAAFLFAAYPISLSGRIENLLYVISAGLIAFVFGVIGVPMIRERIRSMAKSLIFYRVSK